MLGMHYPGTERKSCDCDHALGDSVFSAQAMTASQAAAQQFIIDRRGLLKWNLRIKNSSVEPKMEICCRNWAPIPEAN
jgi:hypothetical protein